MKKIISIALVISIVALMAFAVSYSASAAEPAKTSVAVKSGDTVEYALWLQVGSEPVECADYSVYYDSSVLEVVSVADYTNSFDEDNWESVINTQLTDEVRASFISLKGVDFSKNRNFITVNFKAKKDATTNISYYVRDMAGESYFQDDVNKPEISDYVFTCNVAVSGNTVIENAQPELNTTVEQSVGKFVNSVTGDSKEADVVISNEVSGNNGSNSNSGNVDDHDHSNDAAASDETNADGTPAATSAQVISTAANDDTADTPQVISADTAETAKKSNSSAIIWIIIAVVVVAAGCGIGYYTMKKKPSTAGKSEPAKKEDIDGNSEE